MVMEVANIGVRTRAQVLAMAKRKKCNDQSELASSTIVKLKRRRFKKKKKENSSQSTTSTPHDSGHVLEACCCSRMASELEHDQNFGSINVVRIVEDESDNVEEAETLTFNLDNMDRREVTNTSEPRVESASVKLESSDPDPSPVREPLAGEIEEFFAMAENDLQKQFTKKYNYDFKKDVPLEGRYEWVVNLS